MPDTRTSMAQSESHLRPPHPPSDQTQYFPEPFASPIWSLLVSSPAHGWAGLNSVGPASKMVLMALTGTGLESKRATRGRWVWVSKESNVRKMLIWRACWKEEGCWCGAPSKNTAMRGTPRGRSYVVKETLLA